MNPRNDQHDQPDQPDRPHPNKPRFAPRRANKPPPKPRFEKPDLKPATTTLWDYPSQHYGTGHGNAQQGRAAYTGATPSWVIWQLIDRYTKPGDTVVDPMCGSGTTIDVANDTNRNPKGFDLRPTRPDITQANARKLPLPDACADLVFIDPPYSTHVDYSDDARCIGKLDALPDTDDGGRAYYESMHDTLAECVRVLKPAGYLAIYVSDSWKKRRGRGPDAPPGVFAPIGFELFAMVAQALEPVDHVAVVRHNAKLDKGNWHKAAEEQGYMLRGFNHLMIFHKPTD